MALARPADTARLLGARPSQAMAPQARASERFALAGVIAKVGGAGVALISQDGKPARAFAVGSHVAPGFVLKSVGPREALLADEVQATVQATLVLPPQRDSNAGPPALAGAPVPTANTTGNASAPPPVSVVPGANPAGTPPTQMAPPVRRGDQRGS
ncbi:MAG: hypothetical protein JWQ72_3083 [Polaromonas sp.]|nr:hypothetical protein [Polaromonas sp.]